MEYNDFQEMVWDKGRELFRRMPWRDNTEPYYILVSEIMLQQTQVERVIPKFLEFMQLFPTIETLAAAGLDDVLRAWSGLGYNRRAKFLHAAAQKVASEYKGTFPSTLSELLKLPGVGVNTAGALLAYSFNMPSVFIETNVRTVYFYHLFVHQEVVTDAELRTVVEQTVDKEHPREWYWALMDYGSYLKRSGVSLNAKSRHYKKQPPLKGSVREVRGQIIRDLSKGDVTQAELAKIVKADERFEPALEGLIKDGLVRETAGLLHLTR